MLTDFSLHTGLKMPQELLVQDVRVKNFLLCVEITCCGISNLDLSYLLTALGNPVQGIGRNRPNMSPLLFGFVGFTCLGKA